MKVDGISFYVRKPDGETVRFVVEGSFGKTSKELLMFKSFDYFGDYNNRVMVKGGGLPQHDGTFLTLKEYTLFYGITYGMYSKDLSDFPFWTCGEVSRKQNCNANEKIDLDLVAEEFVARKFGDGYTAITSWRDVMELDEWRKAA